MCLLSKVISQFSLLVFHFPPLSLSKAERGTKGKKKRQRRGQQERKRRGGRREKLAPGKAKNDNPGQRRPPRTPSVVLPRPPPVLLSILLLLLLLGLPQGLLLLPLPALLLPRPPRPRRRPRHHPRRQAQEAPVRPPAGRRPVHGYLHHRPRHGRRRSRRRHRRRGLQPGQRVADPQHKDALPGGEPEQGRDQVRRVEVHGDVQGGSAGEGLRAGVLPGGPQRAAGGGHHRRRPLQSDAGGCVGLDKGRVAERPGGAPGAGRRRGQDPGPKHRLSWRSGIGELCSGDQSKQAVPHVQAVRIRRIARVKFRDRHSHHRPDCFWCRLCISPRIQLDMERQIKVMGEKSGK